MMLPKIAVHLASEPVDMRKSIDGLAALVSDHLSLNPLDGQLFVFYNRQRDKIKILYWQNNGFCLWYKRLERERFQIPATLPAASVAMSAEQLSWLLSGLDFHQLKGHEAGAYSRVI